jgi:para-nitrobenzyl esterase
MNTPQRTLAVLCLSLPMFLKAQELRHVQAAVTGGVIEGVVSADDKVRTFKGVPFAAPPVGPLRWKAPQPVIPWTGVRSAVEYGPRPMQGPIYSDMIFRDGGPSEDCLYLNLWKPEHAQGKLPVMVWIYGGGFSAGSTSEPRQDGGNLCKKGVIVVSMNYRLSVFGFMTLPGLDAESGYGGSGNYGIMDQVAALRWVRANIATFGGDPDNVTIFGESAGSYSVSVIVASPLARGLFNRAIGESGSLVAKNDYLKTHAASEAVNVAFAESLGKHTLADLRAMPAADLLAAAMKREEEEFSLDVDGYVLPQSCLDAYKAGDQAHVPLLAGWNRDEGGYREFFGKDEPTLANYLRLAKDKFGVRSGDFLEIYPAATDAEAKVAAHDYQADKFMGHGTWLWIELHKRTGASPVYRYEFDQPRPLPPNAPAGAQPTASHSWEIEYVFRMLSSQPLAWTPEDRQVSEIISSYWTNFAKTGNPNGEGLAEWPAYDGADGYEVMHIAPTSTAAPDAHRKRYLAWEDGKIGPPW